ncbi:flagellar protein FliO/FliZ [Melghiribacillus thermohalophilus]|uniref:Flagellar protein FliO/FliZ n=1 Tax=Melghiribacillus thermohalophilus TaxID=1324956 RepID=A0A4R3NCX9_9BACI|nr:flagellar biosynthetic protein FliO [Melghiribacillus thermohalophilus]TCT26760.1 flagellar protein FliO/FliZ [Melghiribacillus thermohalophilus]
MKRFFSYVLVFLLTFDLVSPVYADTSGNARVSDMFEEDRSFVNSEQDSGDTSETDTSLATGEQSLTFDIIKMVLALVLVLALIYFLLKFLQKRTKMYQQVRTLENLGGISLGNNKSVQIVRIGKNIYALGVGDNITLLKEISDEETIHDLLNDQQTNLSINQTFQSFFRKWNKKNKVENDTTTQFKKLFQHELTTMKKEREKVIDRYHSRKED